jgi:hypothetical protein
VKPPGLSRQGGEQIAQAEFIPAYGRWPWLPVSLGGMADALAGFLLAWRGIARGVSAADR